MQALDGPVVHLIAPSLTGGAESVVVALSSARKELTRAIVLNQMAEANAPPQALVEQLRHQGVDVDEIRCGRRRYRAEVAAVEERLRQVHASLVHVHGYHATWVGYQAAKRLGLPKVATVHGYLTRTLRERVYNAIDRRLLKGFEAVITVSQEIRQQLLRSGLDARKIHVVQNGIGPTVTLRRNEARRALQLGTEKRVVGWVGRLSHEKGADLFLQALALEETDSLAVIIGEGPEERTLAGLVEALGPRLRDRVRFEGYRPNAAQMLSAFDVIAITSRSEGTPMIILEAVAAGVPIVAFRVGGIPDLLNADSAWLIRPGDIPGLARAIRQALHDRHLAVARADRARDLLAARLSPDKWVQRVWEVYHQAIRPS